MNQPKSELCLCNSQRLFERCCGPYLAGEALAPTAEALMRSRYSAFTQGNFDYLVATRKLSLESPTAAADERQALAQTAKNIRWINLLIVATHKGKTPDKTGVVEFVAVYQMVHGAAAPLLQGEAGVSGLQQLHERSHFIKERSIKDRDPKARRQWLYVTGDMLPPYQPQRSQPCWCGSNQRFGRCHG